MVSKVLGAFHEITCSTELQECISKSAVQTKFKQHTMNGKDITGHLKDTMSKVHRKSASSK